MNTTTSSLASMATSRAEPRELCCYCRTQPYDLTCTCGDKFDFNCIQQHVENISLEFTAHFDQVSEKMVKINDLPETGNNNNEAVQTGIESWRRRRLQDVNDTADKALAEIRERKDGSTDITLIQNTFQRISSELHRMGHENLSLLVELHREIQNKIDGGQDLPEVTYDDASLDALMQAKLNPTLSNTSPHSLSSSANNRDSLTNLNNRNSATNMYEDDSSTNLVNRSSSTDENNRTSSADANNRNSPSNMFRRDLSRNLNNRTSSADANNRNSSSNMPSHDLLTNLNNRTSSADANNRTSPSNMFNRDLSRNPNNQISSADANNRNSPSNMFRRDLSTNPNNQTSSADVNNRNSSSNMPNHDLLTNLNNQTPSADAINRTSSADANNRISSADTHYRTSSTDMNSQDSIANGIEPVAALEIPPTTSNASTIKSPEPTADLTNSSNTNEIPTTEHANNDEFDAGITGRIQRVNPVILPASSDKYAGSVCCHGNQLIYNEMDKTTKSFRLNFVPDISAPSTKISIDWNEPDDGDTVEENDDEWIQDIVYSDKLAGYLILNRARVRFYDPVRKTLDEFVTFNNRSMKRLSSSDKYIYLVSTVTTEAHTGDEITLMTYAKEEKLNKTFRDVIPSRMNRGSGPSVGQISDLAVGTNEQVTLGYRLERRHEVGVCVFNVTNDGREWLCVKQLLLNECWHHDLAYTPRIDWCQKLNVFILIEYMTGHLIMIDRDGQVEGECRFMHAENRKESPINLSISTNDWLCVRYESSINVLKITS